MSLNTPDIVAAKQGRHQCNEKNGNISGNHKVLTHSLFLNTIALIFYFAIACTTYSVYLTNEFTPGGDGGRVYEYLKYMEKVPEIIPFWQGHKHHGYPLLADPENFMFFSLFLDTESPYFNISLNLVFFVLSTLFAFSVKCIAGSIGLSQIASTATGAAVVFCFPVARLFMHGTLSGLLIYTLIFSSIAILLYSLESASKRGSFLLLIVPLLLAPTVQCGYYWPINFHAPAFFLITCYYLKHEYSFPCSIKKAWFVLSVITVLALGFSMPLLLPILDGVRSSKIISTVTSTISIETRDLYNYYFGVWPFMIFAVTFSKGILRKYAWLFLGLASANFILILFECIGFKTFFEIWADVPFLRNIRWQHPFRNLASIACAFSIGIWIDAYRNNMKKGSLKTFIPMATLCLGLLVVLWLQIMNNQDKILIAVTVIFLMVIVVGKKFHIVLASTLIILSLLCLNFSKSPIDGMVRKSTNTGAFKEHNSDYVWWKTKGWDRFSPVFTARRFSMVFLHEYRLLLGVLYNREINEQRPHWLPHGLIMDESNHNPVIAELMAIKHPKKKQKGYNPFRVYDDWQVVPNESDVIRMMKSETFSSNDPIILSEEPGASINSDKILSASAELTGKTAETISLKITTNKNSVLYIPEIYHDGWQAVLNGKKVNVIKAYGSMRAVFVPPGENRLLMRFVYKEFYVGATVFFATLGAWLIILNIPKFGIRQAFFVTRLDKS